MLLTPRCSDPALSEADRERITSYLLASLSPATRAAYATDWQSFTVWGRYIERAQIYAKVGC